MKMAVVLAVVGACDTASPQLVDVTRRRVAAVLTGHKTRVTCLCMHVTNDLAGARAARFDLRMRGFLPVCACYLCVPRMSLLPPPRSLRVDGHQGEGLGRAREAAGDSDAVGSPRGAHARRVLA